MFGPQTVIENFPHQKFSRINADNIDCQANEGNIRPMDKLQNLYSISEAARKRIAVRLFLKLNLIRQLVSFVEKIITC